MLTEEELTRYQRQIILSDWGEERQAKLKSIKAFVAGAGGSGSPILTQLALLGFGTIRICDYDRVDLSNLNRQFIHSVGTGSRIDVNKALSAAKTISNINPNINVEVIQERIDESNVDQIVGEADILFDSVDHIPTKFILSASAIRKNIPHLFYGMMDINSFFVTLYPPETPCFHCLYDATKVSAIQLVAGKLRKLKKRETPVSCPSLFLSTGFAANEALKILLGIGEPAYRTYFLFLQKNNSSIGATSGFAGMRYWISDYFKKLCIDQGFDWEIGWRNTIIEELKVNRDPHCTYCAHL
jgi:adenylyltransferase/sulfurtransferase